MVNTALEQMNTQLRETLFLLREKERLLKKQVSVGNNKDSLSEDDMREFKRY